MSAYRYKLKKEPTGLFDRVDMGCGRMRGINDDCKVFDLSKLKNAVVIAYCVGGRARISLGRKIKFCFGGFFVLDISI